MHFGIIDGSKVPRIEIPIITGECLPRGFGANAGKLGHVGKIFDADRHDVSGTIYVLELDVNCF